MLNARPTRVVRLPVGHSARHLIHTCHGFTVSTSLLSFKRRKDAAVDVAHEAEFLNQSGSYLFHFSLPSLREHSQKKRPIIECKFSKLGSLCLNVILGIKAFGNVLLVATDSAVYRLKKGESLELIYQHKRKITVFDAQNELLFWLGDERGQIWRILYAEAAAAEAQGRKTMETLFHWHSSAVKSLFVNDEIVASGGSENVLVYWSPKVSSTGESFRPIGFLPRLAYQTLGNREKTALGRRQVMAGLRWIQCNDNGVFLVSSDDGYLRVVFHNRIIAVVKSLKEVVPRLDLWHHAMAKYSKKCTTADLLELQAMSKVSTTHKSNLLVVESKCHHWIVVAGLLKGIVQVIDLTDHSVAELLVCPQNAPSNSEKDLQVGLCSGGNEIIAVQVLPSSGLNSSPVNLLTCNSIGGSGDQGFAILKVWTRELSKMGLATWKPDKSFQVWLGAKARVIRAISCSDKAALIIGQKNDDGAFVGKMVDLLDGKTLYTFSNLLNFLDAVFSDDATILCILSRTKGLLIYDASKGTLLFSISLLLPRELTDFSAFNLQISKQYVVFTFAQQLWKVNLLSKQYQCLHFSDISSPKCVINDDKLIVLLGSSIIEFNCKPNLDLFRPASVANSAYDIDDNKVENIFLKGAKSMVILTSEGQFGLASLEPHASLSNVADTIPLMSKYEPIANFWKLSLDEPLNNLTCSASSLTNLTASSSLDDPSLSRNNRVVAPFEDLFTLDLPSHVLPKPQQLFSLYSAMSSKV